MKKTNKGFSMVELIIVIAIMAILAGAIAPALIKYINKSRLSTDIQTGTSLATAMQTALANEAAFDAAPNNSGSPSAVPTTVAGSFWDEVDDTVSLGKLKVKAKKDLSGASMGTTFFYEIDPSKNLVIVYCGKTDAAHECSPTPGPSLTK